MQIRFNNFQRQYLAHREEFDSAYIEVMNSGNYILGEQVRKFENNFAEYCGSKYCISCGNGLDAIYLILKALNIGPGDEVIVPSNTYIATWIGVSRTGAIPVPVEPDNKTFNIDPSLIEEKISEHTKVILPVDLFGQPCSYDEILTLKNNYPNLKVVVDSAQSHGAKYKNKRVGSIADATAFSFYPTKNIGAIGDAGCITTNDEEIAQKVSMLRNYGTSERYNSKYIGINSRMDEIQAAFLSVKLSHLGDTNTRRSDIARYYLSNISNQKIGLPFVNSYVDPSWYVFVIRSQYRDKLKIYLSENMIDSIVHYPIPPHLQEAYKSLNFSRGSFPIAEKLADELISLPTDPFLTDEEVSYLVNIINKFNP